MIRALRERNWIAAHIRERRYELDLTQQEVARRAGTSHSFISKLERGEHIPTIPVLNRILAVLDEQLLIGIEPSGSDEMADVRGERLRQRSHQGCDLESGSPSDECSLTQHLQTPWPRGRPRSPRCRGGPESHRGSRRRSSSRAATR